MRDRRTRDSAPDGYMPPNISFGTPPPQTPRRAAPSARKRRYLPALAMACLVIAAFAIGSSVALTTGTSKVAVGQIQSMVLPMADDGVDDEAGDGAVQPEFVVEPVSQVSCHPAYLDCIPLDIFEDLDCADLAISDVRLADVAWDPYDLDTNDDGVGCESS